MTDYINAGDAKAWKQCKRRVWYDHNPPAGVEPVSDAFESLIQQAGEDHEKKVLALLSKNAEVVEATSIEHTQALIKRRTPVIYQPLAQDELYRVVAKPDFLVLRESGEYQVVDAKLATSLKGRPDLQIQLGLYRRLFNSRLPAQAYLGGGAVEEVDEKIEPRCEEFIKDMQKLLAEAEPPNAYFAYSKAALKNGPLMAQ